jgi:hypothetical protein
VSSYLYFAEVSIEFKLLALLRANTEFLDLEKAVDAPSLFALALVLLLDLCLLFGTRVELLMLFGV